MKQYIKRGAIGSLAIGLLAAGMLSGPVAVAAKSDAIIRTGSCTGSSDWKLKAKLDNGRIEVEYEVDQNVNGQVWNVKLKDNGTKFWQGQKTTQAPSGSFSVTKRTNNAAGTDTIVGRAVNSNTGEVCVGTLNF